MVTNALTMDKTENCLTISTKLSTDHLICKSPRCSSPASSEKCAKVPLKDEGSVKKGVVNVTGLYLGVLQIVFGLLMAVFGVLVLVNDASLSQIGGGLWGGCLATLTGVLGVLSAAKDCCPLKTSPQRIALTVFLAFSLISLAVANLVLVLAAIGLARDANHATINTPDTTEQFEDGTTSSSLDEILGGDYSCFFYGSCLLLVAACECITAALSAWHSAKYLCSCFNPSGSSVNSTSNNVSAKDLMVSSWLGKHHQPLYVVHTTQRRNKMAPLVAPMYPLPTPPPSIIPPPIVRYPLIPAPLGTTPPPIIPTHTHTHTHTIHPPSPEKVHKKQRWYPNDKQLPIKPIERPKKQKKSRDKQKPITEEEVARTYTGLDRVIAEEFIEICDSTKNSFGTESSGSTSLEIASKT